MSLNTERCRKLYNPLPKPETIPLRSTAHTILNNLTRSKKLLNLADVSVALHHHLRKTVRLDKGDPSLTVGTIGVTDLRAGGCHVCLSVNIR
jgi:hypothetical protein